MLKLEVPSHKTTIALECQIKIALEPFAVCFVSYLAHRVVQQSSKRKCQSCNLTFGQQACPFFSCGNLPLFSEIQSGTMGVRAGERRLHQVGRGPAWGVSKYQGCHIHDNARKWNCRGNGEMAGYLVKDSGKWSTQGETAKLKPICEKSTGGEGLIQQFKSSYQIFWYRWEYKARNNVGNKVYV